MAESYSVFCESCEHIGSITQAEAWCNDCKEGYCKECIKAHQVAKALRSHHLISISDNTIARNLPVNDICAVHKRQLDFFCTQHDLILCLECVQTNHSKCKIENTSDASIGSKSSAAVAKLEEEMSNVIKNIESGLQCCDRDVADLKQQEKAILSTIQDIRDRINLSLDKLQEKLTEELNSKRHQGLIEIEKFNAELNTKHKKLNKLKESITHMKTYASEKQMFIGIKQTSEEIVRQKKSVSEQLDHYIKFKLSAKIDDTLLDLLQNSKKIGDVELKSESNLLHYVDPLKAQAQIYRPLISGIDTINLQLNRTIRVLNPLKNMSLTSCAMLPNKKTVFVDNCNKRLILHEAGGQYEADVKLRGVYSPFDISVMDNDKFAVSKQNAIDVINIHSLKVERSITDFEYNCWGISFEKEKFYVGTYKRIAVIDLHGNITNNISCDVRHVYNTAVFQDCVYYMDWAKRSLFCCNTNGEGKWRFKDERFWPSGKFFLNWYSTSLCIDNYGNIFLALPNSDVILLVSSDGQQSRVLLDKTDKLNEPSGVYFDKVNKQLLVCNAQDAHAAVYDVQY